MALIGLFAAVPAGESPWTVSSSMSTGAETGGLLLRARPVVRRTGGVSPRVVGVVARATSVLVARVVGLPPLAFSFFASGGAFRTGWLDVEGRKKDADWAGLRADIERVKRTTSSTERAVLPTTSRVFSRDIEGAGRW